MREQVDTITRERLALEWARMVDSMHAIESAMTRGDITTARWVAATQLQRDASAFARLLGWEGR